MKTITNAILEIKFLLVYSIPARIKGLPGVADSENITNAILEILFFYRFIPARFKGLPGVADSENHYKCNLRNFIFLQVYSCQV